MARQAKTPAQSKRNQYLASVRARGASGYNLWFVSPPQDPLDPPLILNSDVEHECFLFLEGEPDLARIDYAPLREAEEGPRSGRRRFAIGTTLDGYQVDIDLDPAGEGKSPPGRRVVDLALLDNFRIRTNSWRAIIPAITRCRSHELSAVIFRCRHLIEEQPHITMGALHDQVDEHPALLDGAIGTMLRTRELGSDVDDCLWGPATKLWSQSRG